MADVFDNLLIDSCDILKKVSYDAGGDAYGQPAQDFITIVAAWPCRVTTMAGGHEYKAGKELAKNTFRVFMRPPDETDSGVPFELGTHHWIKVITSNGVTRSTPMYLNVLAVNDPSLLGHHLELIGEQVIP